LRAVVPAPDEGLRRDLGPLWEGEAAAPAEGDPELLRFRRFDALRAVLAAAAARAPLVVILDDLHAADTGSILALKLVVQALRGRPVLLAATHREGDGLLAPLRRQGASTQLGRLGRDDVARLMHGLEPVSAELVDDVYRTSAGNPLFVEETLRLVRSGGRADRAPEGRRVMIRGPLARPPP